MMRVETRESIVIENEGEKIFAVLHRPLQKGPVPGVVLCCGFGGNKTGKQRISVNLAKRLASEGIAVLRFDYRGTGDSEGESQDVTIEGKISDTLKCLTFLAADPQIDSSRLGLLGRSLGGAIAVLSADRFEGIKSLVLWSALFTSTPWRELWRSLGRSLGSKQTVDSANQDILRHLPINMPNETFIKEFFALDLGASVVKLQDIPLLLLHGSQDEVVKVEQAREYEKARHGIDNTRVIILPKSDHDFSDPSEQAVVLSETIAWYKKTL